MATQGSLSRLALPADAVAALEAVTKQQLDGKQPLDADLTAIAALAAANDDVIQRKSGAWVNRTLAQLKTDLSLQPLDADLTTIAGLTATTDNFLQAKASAWASRTVAQVKTDLGLAVATVTDRVAAGFGTSTSTAFTATISGGGVAGVPFVAPPSGKVMIISNCYMWNSGANTTLCGFEVRTGATVGSGTIYTGAADNDSLLTNGTNGMVVEKSFVDEGLTPGSSYNVRQLVRVSAGTGTWNRHSITVVPLAA